MNKLNQNVTKGKPSREVFKSPIWIQNFATITKAKATIRLTFLFIVTLCLAFQIPKLQFNYDFDSFFPKGDKDLAYNEMLNDEFGEFNDFLFVVLKTEKPRSKSFLTQANTTIENIRSWAQIEDIQSIFDLKKIQVTPFGINQIKLVSPTRDLSSTPSFESMIRGRFLGRDEQSMLFMIRHKAFEDKEEADSFYKDLSLYLQSMFGQDYLISGKIQMQHDFTQKLEEELSRLLLIALAFVVVVLTLLFRSPKGVAIPILTLVITIIWTMGLLSLMGKSIDVMIVIIPAILLIVALSDVIHFVHKYDEFKNAGLDKAAALKSCFLFIGKATCLTSITTCAGFLSLYIIPIKPIQDFGLYTALGVLFAFIVTFLLIPSLLYFFSQPVERDGTIQSAWRRSLSHMFLGVIKNRRKVIWLFAITTITLVSGLAFLKINTSIIVGFQNGEPELKQVAYFDENFDGYKPFEIGINLAQDKTLFDTEVLGEIEKIETFVSRNYKVSHIQSPLNIIRGLNSSLYGASAKYLKLPVQKDLNRVRRFYDSPRLRNQKQMFQGEKNNTIRLIGRSKDVGSAEARKLNASLNDFISEEINSKILKAKLTGTSFLIDKTDNYIVNSLLKGLAVATLSISFFLFLFFRDWKIVVVSLIPNLVPIFMLFGLMGILQIDLNISTAIIFTVAFGIAVDDSIHLIARYYIERPTLSPIWALKKSFTGAGKSIIVTSMVIITGFSLFMTSGLSSPFYLGFFIAITAIIALILDLTILPLIILRFSKKD